MIDPERLVYVPEQHHEKHSFCFWIHDLIADGIKQAEAARVANVHFTFRDDEDKKAFAAAPDIITYALESNRHDLARRIVLNQSVIPLYADALHFMFEGMSMLEKHKHTVSIALFRKPLRQNLLFLTWIFADEHDYFTRFHADASNLDDSRKLTPKRIKELLKAANEKLRVSFNTDLIYKMVFDKTNEGGLGHYFDQAVHLVTNQGAIKTEDMNLNMIFTAPTNDDIYDGIYHILGYVFMYLLFLEIEMFGQMTKVPEFYRQWLDIATWTTYHAIFGDSSVKIDEFNSAASTLLSCLLCKKPLRLTRENALEFFAAEHITCSHCRSFQGFPFYWLIARMEDDKTSATIV